TVSGNQQFVRLVFGPDLADWSRDRAAERDAKNKKSAAKKAATQTPAADPPPAEQPISGSGTPDDPHRYKSRPDPVLPTAIPKKDDTPPDPDLQEVRGQRHIRTQSLDDVELARANRDAVGDPIPPGHQDHHVSPKDSGGESGESIRDTLRNTGESVNAPEAQLAARGVNRETVDPDRRVTTVQDTVADHTKQHGEKKISPLEKRLGTATGDDDAVRGIHSDTSLILSEGRTPEDPEFYLDSQHDRGTDDHDDKPPKKPRGGGSARKKKN
ncbi:MAG TPA: hypothetical protein VKD71_08095, partial [Gemmataceae bacterium]|nr:hypothetical protein [Gemmataceae bacterium]